MYRNSGVWGHTLKILKIVRAHTNITDLLRNVKLYRNHINLVQFCRDKNHFKKRSSIVWVEHTTPSKLLDRLEHILIQSSIYINTWEMRLKRSYAPCNIAIFLHKSRFHNSNIWFQLLSLNFSVVIFREFEIQIGEKVGL